MNSFRLPLVASLLPLAATSVAISISHSDKFVFIVGTGPAKLTRFKTGISVGRWAEVTESRMGTEDVFVVGRANLWKARRSTALAITRLRAPHRLRNSNVEALWESSNHSIDQAAIRRLQGRLGKCCRYEQRTLMSSTFPTAARYPYEDAACDL